MAAPFAAPPTPVNASVTAHRNIAYTQPELADIKTVKNHFNATVNDVVIALCAAVLRRFLLDRGELPDRSLVAMVPVSVHETSNRPGRNRVSGMFCRLQTHIDHPTERLHAIAEANSVAKEHRSTISPTDGRLLAAGGTEHYDPFYGLTDALIFDPMTLAWTAVDHMEFRPWYPTLVMLGGGNVVAVSGLGDNHLSVNPGAVRLRDVDVVTASRTGPDPDVRAAGAA